MEGKTPEEIQAELENEFNPEEKGWNVVSVRKGRKSIILKVDQETEEKIKSDTDLQKKRIQSQRFKNAPSKNCGTSSTRRRNL